MTMTTPTPIRTILMHPAVSRREGRGATRLARLRRYIRDVRRYNRQPEIDTCGAFRLAPHARKRVDPRAVANALREALAAGDLPDDLAAQCRDLLAS